MKALLDQADADARRLDQPRISVIVPTLDEEALLARALDSALAAAGVEVIVADGGSRDRTVAIARGRGARVVRAARGRAVQMNAGAEVARGEILVFLHADTLLPAGWDASVRHILARPGVAAGAFRLSLDRRSALLACVTRAANARSRFFGLPYGDQAIFLGAATFGRAGGFPEIPIMEDVVLVRRLARGGRIVLSDQSVLTSARRWATHGVVRTTVVNGACLLAHFSGFSAQRIAAFRREHAGRRHAQPILLGRGAGRT